MLSIGSLCIVRKASDCLFVQICDLLENDPNLLLKLLHQSSEEKTAEDARSISRTAVSSSDSGSHSSSASSLSSSSSSVSSSPHLADDQAGLGLYSDTSHDSERSVAVDRSRLSLERGGMACGFYRCSLIAHYKNEDELKKEEEIGSFKKEKEHEKHGDRESSCIGKLAVVVDFTTFADLSGPTDIFLAMKYRHILLSDYSLVSLFFLRGEEREKLCIFSFAFLSFLS